MPETCPSSQLFGSGLGQNGSTWNCGSVAAFWAGAETAAANAIAAPSHALMIFMCFLPGERTAVVIASGNACRTTPRLRD